MEYKQLFTRYISEEEVYQVNLAMNEAINIVERVYEDHGNKNVTMSSKSSVPINVLSEDISTGASIMGGYIKRISTVGIKWIGSNFNNIEKYNIPNLIATIILNDSENFYPKAIIQGGAITALRTAAATAVGIKYFAKKDASFVTIIGTGYQAYFQLKGVISIIRPKCVFAYDINKENLELFINDLKREFLHTKIVKVSSPEEGINKSEIVITATSAKDASLVKWSYLKPR